MLTVNMMTMYCIMEDNDSNSTNVYDKNVLYYVV